MFKVTDYILDESSLKTANALESLWNYLESCNICTLQHIQSISKIHNVRRRTLKSLNQKIINMK